MGSWNSLNRQTTGSTFSSGKRKKNKQSCSFCSFFSNGLTLLTHAAPERQEIHWRGQSYTHSMHSFLPPELLSFSHFFSSYGRRRGGDRAAGAWENKNPGRMREQRKRRRQKEREEKKKKEGGQKLKWMAFSERHKWTVWRVAFIVSRPVIQYD